MATPDSVLSSLDNIRIKVRRLTRSPSTSQLTDVQIDDYVNTFALYDFPQFTVDKKLTFFLSPNVDTYGNNTVNANDPLYNFINKYSSIKKPVFVGGQEVSLTESREQFFLQYNKFNYTESIGTGNGATVAFSGTLSNIPVLGNSVTFSSIDTSGNAIIIKDVPIIGGSTGIQTQAGNLVTPDATTSLGTINYLTGVYSFAFPVAPGSGEDVVAQTYAYTAGRPLAVCYVDNSFIFRPVPDKTYRVEMDCYQRPSEFLSGSSTPEVALWWQYIAYGAAKKVFEDRMDQESIEAIMPEYMRQRLLVLERLVIQQSEQRTATIYTERGADFYVDKSF